MRSPLMGKLEPYKLSEGPHFFVDWRYVQAGAVGWVSKDGRPIGLWGPEGVVGPVDAQPAPRSVPRGIRLVAQKAQKSEPFLTWTKPWERMIFCYSTLIYDERLYRLWYECVSPEQWTKHTQGSANLLCYAESKDGIAWDKPSLGIVKYEGLDTNIVFGGNLCPESGFTGGTVFVDPSAPSSERYKVIFLGKASRQKMEEYRRNRPNDIDPIALSATGEATAVFGGTSPDGLHWKQVPEPLVVQCSDTQNTAYYDPQLKRYVWYARCNWYYGRRSVGRAETDNFRRIPLPEMILWPGPNLLPSDDWYTNAKTLYPGTNDIHLMFPAMYHRAEDNIEIYMASSPDGILWSLLPGGPALSPGPPGSWDGGCIFAGCGLVPLPNNRIGLPYVGFPVPHKYPRSQPMGAIAYAWWPKGRLAALEAPGIGEFSTPQLLFTGRKLLLNFQTKRTGEILVEVANSRGQTLPGRSFSDADPLNGDFLDFPVTWKGEADLGYEPGQPVILRFHMRASKLFAFEFV